MDKYLKFLGVALVIIGAILLTLPMIFSSMADLADENWFTLGNLTLIIIGLISHIILNKTLEY